MPQPHTESPRARFTLAPEPRTAPSPTLDAQGKHRQPPSRARPAAEASRRSQPPAPAAEPRPGSPHSKKQTLSTPKGQTISSRASPRSTPRRTELESSTPPPLPVPRTRRSPRAKRVLRSTTTAEAPAFNPANTHPKTHQPSGPECQTKRFFPIRYSRNGHRHKSPPAPPLAKNCQEAHLPTKVTTPDNTPLTPRLTPN